MMMRVDEMDREDALLAREWLTERIRKRTGRAELEFPEDWLPETGRAVVGREHWEREERLLAVAMLYLEKSSPVAVCGWCIGNPGNVAKESDQAVRLLLGAMPNYARVHGARHLLTMFGRRSVNRICDELGYITGDPEVETKYMKL